MGVKMYSSELKERLVQLASEGVPVSQLAREYEPTATTIYGWVQKSKEPAVELDTQSDIETELQRLRVENRRLREVIVVLEKATAWFSRDPRRGYV